jgi:hypothetical protein
MTKLKKISRSGGIVNAYNAVEEAMKRTGQKMAQQ